MSITQERARNRMAEVIEDDPIRASIAALEVDGRVTPDSVVDAASNPDSPLHSRFEWDDTKAGHAYRLEQARTLIRSVKVQITVEDRVISTVHYVRDPSAESEQGYVSVDKIKTEPSNASAMLEAEFVRAAAAMRRAQSLADAVGARASVDSILRRIESARRNWTHIEA